MSGPSYPYSIIATTYNQAIDLDLYLQSLTKQSRQDFEIVIADDGSKEDTRAVIQRHQNAFFKDRLKHIWHEDLGYRKCKILNKAIRESSGNWLIFTDSDLILHPRFVDDHIQYQKRNAVFMGRRVDLNPSVSNWLRTYPEKMFGTEFYIRIFGSRFGSKPSRNAQRSIRIASPVISKAIGYDQVPDLLGSNFSIDRELLFRVNGFDEASEHYWGEDGDLFIRIRNSGAEIFGRKAFAVQWHLWHQPRSPKPDAEENYRQKLKIKDYVRCDKGLAV